MKKQQEEEQDKPPPPPPRKHRTDPSIRRNKGPRAMILAERNVTDQTYVITFGDGDLKLLFNIFVDKHTATRTIYLSGVDRFPIVQTI